MFYIKKKPLTKEPTCFLIGSKEFRVGDEIKILYGANSYGQGIAIFKITEISSRGNVYGECWKRDKSSMNAKRKKLIPEVIPFEVLEECMRGEE